VKHNNIYMKIKKNYILFFSGIIFFTLFLIIAIASILYIYEKRNQISEKLKKENKYSMSVGSLYDLKRVELAKKIINGGYILFFRHAERERWIDVQMYDATEINKKLLAENTYFKNAVCLSKKGLVQARLMGEIIKDINLPIEKVISSPSCRARQTAELSFNGYDEISNIFMHAGPFFETNKSYSTKLKKKILEYIPSENSNIVISGHGNVIKGIAFDKIENNTKFDLEEGGFYVMKIDGKKLILVDKFFSFHYFNVVFQKRPN
jgi:broad specificity phosphatase PhoE